MAQAVKAIFLLPLFGLSQGSPSCCGHQTASCLACQYGKTEAEICEINPDLEDCAPRCCMAMTAGCLACQHGTTEEEICKIKPDLDGCEKKCSCEKDPQPPGVEPCPPAECVEWSDNNIEIATCKWFMEESRIQVHNARVYTGYAGRDCPWGGPSDKGLLHHSACAACALKHKPCEGTFAACPGCCFTAGPGPNKTIMCDRVPQHHTCDDFQRWFFDHNSISLNCTDQVPVQNVAKDIRDYLNNITVDIVEPVKYGTFESSCEWNATTAECKGIPTKLRLDCTDCAIKAVPELLRMCCDQGVAIANGQHMKNLRLQGLAPQLWIDGCHDPTLEMPWYPYFVNFPDYVNYADFTEQRADEKMRASVTNNYCAKGVPENKSLCIKDPWHIVNARNKNCQPRRLGSKSSPGSCDSGAASEPAVFLAAPAASGTFEEVDMVVTDNRVVVTSRSARESTSTTLAATTTTNNSSSSASGQSLVVPLVFGSLAMLVI